MWTGGNKIAIQERIASLSRDEKMQFFDALLASNDQVGRGMSVLELPSPDNIVQMLAKASPEQLDMLRRLLGPAACQTACSTNTGGCYGRRLSTLEEARLRANKGGAIDIPAIGGANGTVTINVPIYGIEYFLEQFSMDGEIAVNTGSVNQVEVIITHAGFPLAEFRVSQYYKQSCCTTIADTFRNNGLCLGWNSTFTLTITNRNALAAEAFIHGVFSYARGYPNPNTGQI